VEPTAHIPHSTPFSPPTNDQFLTPAHAFAIVHYFGYYAPSLLVRGIGLERIGCITPLFERSQPLPRNREIPFAALVEVGRTRHPIHNPRASLNTKHFRNDGHS
jgi:hypothetical protein